MSATINHPTFATLLREFREDAGFSMAGLARAADCDHSLISRYESGQRKPTRAMVEHLSDVLGLNPATRARLLLAAGFASGQEALSDYPELLDIARRIDARDIHPSVLVAIRTLIRVLADTSAPPAQLRRVS